MESGGIDIDKVRSFLRQRRRARELRLSARLEEARLDAARILDRIVRELAPLRVYQWGSLLSGHHFSEISDIDFAVEGLAGPAQYFQAVGIAMEETRFPVDVVEIEKLDVHTRDRIVNHGRLVYDRIG